MKHPYLIQRAKFQDKPHPTDTGIDKILSFDYMGSSEFEWGALPKSLKRIRQDIDYYIQFQYSFTKHPAKVVTVFCTKQQQEFVPQILELLSEDRIWLKETCDLPKYISGDVSYPTNDFWWDIENDWFFWKFNPEFDLKFKSSLVNK